MRVCESIEAVAGGRVEELSAGWTVMRLRVGVIGMGRGWAHAEVFRAFEGVSVVAVCDPSAARRQRAGEYFHLEAAYEDVARFLEHELDVVVVASPPEVHAEHAIAALNRGCHVVCEVPMVYSFDFFEAHRQAEQLVEAVLSAERLFGARFMFAENTNYWWFVEDWRRRIREGALGKLLYAEAEYIHDCRPLMRNPDGSLTWRAFMPPIFYCTHSLGPLLSWMEARPARVAGFSVGSHLDPELPAPDIEVALVTLESGAVVKVLCGFKVARQPPHHYFCVYGTKGSLETGRNQDRAFAHFEEGEPKGMSDIPFSRNHPNAPEDALVGGHGTCEFFMTKDFLRALREGLPMPIDVFDGLEMTLPGIYAHESALRGGIPLEIPDFRRRFTDS